MHADHSSTSDLHPDVLRAMALHAWLTARLQRSYLHEMRNGLHGLYIGFDALTRANLGASMQTTAERAAALLKQAMAAHEQSLQRIVENLLVREELPATIDLGGQVREMARFLSNEAAAHDVSLQVECAEALYATARVDKIRLVLFSLAVDAIDSAANGCILKCVAALQDARPTVELSVAHGGEGLKSEMRERRGDSALNSNERASWRALIFPVARFLVAADQGTLHCTGDEATWQSVRISYPLAKSVQSLAG